MGKQIPDKPSSSASPVSKQQQVEEVQGGRDTAIEFLQRALGKKKADAFADKWQEKEIANRFFELEKFAVDDFYLMLKEEGEQTIALVLSKLSPSYSAKVLAKLPSTSKGVVARKIASLKEVSPLVLQAVFLKLNENLKKLQQQEGLSVGGEKHLREILRRMDAQSEEDLLQTLTQEDPDMGARLRAALYSFEELLSLTAKEIRLLVQAIPDKNIWAVALKGAGTAMQRHILQALSVNRSAEIVAKMQEWEGLPLQEIESKRKHIMQKVKELENENQILVRKDF